MVKSLRAWVPHTSQARCFPWYSAEIRLGEHRISLNRLVEVVGRSPIMTNELDSRAQRPLLTTAPTTMNFRARSSNIDKDSYFWTARLWRDAVTVPVLPEPEYSLYIRACEATSRVGGSPAKLTSTEMRNGGF